MTNTRRAALLSTTAMLSFSVAGAQISSDDVIVTATKISAPVQSIGASVSVVGGDPLATFDGAEELTQRVAGLQAAVANGSQIAFQIRGIGAVDHQALTPTATAVYVDGVYQATNVQTSPLLFDMERAEVLKGPQGSLYGRNASAGAINFVSKRPGDEAEGYVRSEIGTFNRFNLNAAATVPVSDDLSLRLSGRYLSQDAVIDNVVTDPAVSAPKDAGGVRDEFGLRAIAAYDVSDKTQIVFNVHYAEDNGVNASPRNEGRAASANLGDHEISVGPTGVRDTDNEFYGASVELTHDFGNFDLFSLTAFEGFNQDYGFDFAAVPQTPFNFFVGQTAGLKYDRNLDQFSHETRLSRKGSWYDSMVGIYLEAEDFDQEYLVFCGQLNEATLVGSCNYLAADRRVGPSPVPTGEAASTLQSLINQERKTAALFTYNTYRIAPKFDLVAGLRVSKEEIDGNGEGRHIFTDGSFGLNNTCGVTRNTDRTCDLVVGPAIGKNSIDDTKVTGNLGLNFQPRENALVYASVSTGYKSGGFNGEVIDNAAHFQNAGLFRAETVTGYEFGAKLTAGTARFNIAAFYNDYDDPQSRFFNDVTLDDGTVISLNRLSNLAAATSKGIEFDVAVKPTEKLSLRGAMALLDTDIKDSEFPALDGNPLPFASNASGVLGATYDFRISPTVTATADMNYKYQSEFTLGADVTGNSFVQDGYGLLDITVDFLASDQYEFGVWGRNLTNEDYAVSAYRFDGDTTFRGAPRTYGVSLGYKY